jgi:hypothetical protein
MTHRRCCCDLAGGSGKPIQLRLVTVARWTLSMQPTCTARAGPRARSVPTKSHSPGDQLTCLYPQPGPQPNVQVQPRNGLAVQLTVPAGGFVIYG